MAKLSFQETRVIEQILVQSGYVLHFNNKTFHDFFADCVGIDIDALKYSEENSGSKGKRLMQFIRLEEDYVVGKLLASLYEPLIEFDKTNEPNKGQEAYAAYIKIYERLVQGGVVEYIDAIQANNDDKDFVSLAKLIRESIDKNEPEAALDRLHTFLIKFLKELCTSHEVQFAKDDVVNALYGKYIKKIREKGFIESQMAEKIVQFSFQIMDAFNDVRNNKSYAHDNPLLNYDESVLIFSNVSSMVKFLQSIEAKHKNKAVEEAAPDWGQF